MRVDDSCELTDAAAVCAGSSSQLPAIEQLNRSVFGGWQSMKRCGQAVRADWSYAKVVTRSPP